MTRTGMQAASAQRETFFLISLLYYPEWRPKAQTGHKPVAVDTVHKCFQPL
jgi:hypothetical protein